MTRGRVTILLLAVCCAALMLRLVLPASLLPFTTAQTLQSAATQTAAPAATATTSTDETWPASTALPVFFYADVYIDSGASPLAAFQVEVNTGHPAVRVVGVEEGEHPAFQGERFFFDGRTIQTRHSERVIIASFSTSPAQTLPTGQVRVARIHLVREGVPAADLRIELQAGASVDGRGIDATATILEGTQP